MKKFIILLLVEKNCLAVCRHFFILTILFVLPLMSYTQLNSQNSFQS